MRWFWRCSKVAFILASAAIWILLFAVVVHNGSRVRHYTINAVRDLRSFVAEIAAVATDQAETSRGDTQENEELARTRAEIVELRAQHQREVLELNKHLADAASAKDVAVARLVGVRVECEQLKAQHVREMRELNKQVVDVETSKEQVVTRLVAVQGEYEQLRAQYREGVSDLNQRLSWSVACGAKSKDRIAELEGKVIAATRKASFLESQLNDDRDGERQRLVVKSINNQKRYQVRVDQLETPHFRSPEVDDVSTSDVGVFVPAYRECNDCGTPSNCDQQEVTRVDPRVPRLQWVQPSQHVRVRGCDYREHGVRHRYYNPNP